MSDFCALCTSDRGPFVRRRLSQLEPEVVLCVACDSETPRQMRSRPVERGYVAPGGLLTAAETRAAASKVVDPERWQRDSDAILQMQRAPTKVNTEADNDYIGFKQETNERIRTKANELRSHKSSRERHTLK